MLELEQVALIDQPLGAVAPSPQGQLGTGGSYRSANGNQSATLFIKQGYFKIRDFVAKGSSLKLGRFEFSEGLETASSDSTVAFIKRERIAQRLLGANNFTHVGRSYDGLDFTTDKPNHNTTLVLAFPTRSGYSLRGMDTLTGVKFAYAASTSSAAGKHGALDGRVFGLLYSDSRKGIAKTDSRPSAVRNADQGDINILTLGAHLVSTGPILGGKADGMIWMTGQIGSWGQLNHGAFAFAAEAGYQPRHASFSPWLRAGYYYASGDGNPANNQHGTYFPVLPTSRPYARLPFYSQMNLKDAFAQLILRPNPDFTVRTDFHLLALADSNDLWYSGSGAAENLSFGYSGKPGGGARSLAKLYDISLDWQMRKNASLALYFGYADGGSVVRASFTGSSGLFGFAEYAYRF